MSTLNNRLITLLKDLVESHSIKDKYSLLLEFAIDDNSFDKDQIKELLSFTKELVNNKVSSGKIYQRQRSILIPDEVIPSIPLEPIKMEPIKTKQTKPKRYNRVEIFNDNMTDNFTCMSCGDPIVGQWIFKHLVDGKYQCWHPDNKCIPIQRLTEFITRPRYKLYLAENKTSTTVDTENDDIVMDDAEE